jgi:hypothetical protein
MANSVIYGDACLLPDYCIAGRLVRGHLARGLAIMEKFSYLMCQPNYAW